MVSGSKRPQPKALPKRHDQPRQLRPHIYGLAGGGKIPRGETLSYNPILLPKINGVRHFSPGARHMILGVWLESGAWHMIKDDAEAARHPFVHLTPLHYYLICACIFAFNPDSLGTPIICSTTLPPLKIRKVGILIMPNFCAVTMFSSTFILPIFTGFPFSS